MKVILKKDVYNLGNSGDIKEVRDGYARNFLIPKGFVMSASARSVKEQNFLDQVRKQKIIKRKKSAAEMASTMNNIEVTLTAKMGDEGKMFGSITNHHIAAELDKLGYQVDKRTIHLDEPIKNLGKYTVKVKMFEDIVSNIKLTVQDETGNSTPYVPPKVVETTSEVNKQTDEAAEKVE